jgi:enoyl-CoA hydratase
MDYQFVSIETRDGWALVTISRPEALNALSAAVLDELSHAVAEIELDDAIRAVVITGAGKAFVAGADIGQMVELGPRQALELAEKGAQLGAAIESSEVPFIAAVNGFALGGGCELALACDFIYASEKAKLGQPEVKLGVIPGFGGTQRLARRVGVAKAKELIFTGDMIGADEAFRIGLVDKVTPPGELLDACAATCGRIAANGPLAIAEAKRIIHQGQSMALEHGVQLEMHGFAALFDTEDRREGMSAFLDKREPVFKRR